MSLIHICDTGFIVRMCLWLVVLGGVGLLSSVTAQYFSAKAAIGFSAKLRHVLMAHIQTLSYTELDTVGTSTLITRMNSDINQVQTGVNMCLRLLLRSPFVVFGAMVMAFTIDTKCALIFAGEMCIRDRLYPSSVRIRNPYPYVACSFV